MLLLFLPGSVAFTDTADGRAAHRLVTESGIWSAAIALGRATAELTPFKRVVGVDPSAKMIEVAKQLAIENAQSTNSEIVNQFEYVQSEAENLSFLKDVSIS
jgi:ubiquinone/menaquinone biosynthesis C-methylase UbiE